MKDNFLDFMEKCGDVKNLSTFLKEREKIAKKRNWESRILNDSWNIFWELKELCLEKGIFPKNRREALRLCKNTSLFEDIYYGYPPFIERIMKKHLS